MRMYSIWALEWRVGVKTLFIEPLLTIGRMAPSRAFFCIASRRAALAESVWHAARGQGALRAVAAALQLEPAAQRLGIPAPESLQPRAFASAAPQQMHGAGLLEGKNPN